MPCLHPQYYEHGSVQSATHPHSVFYPHQTLLSSKGFRLVTKIQKKSLHHALENA
jgi:hypothetical protein